LNVQKKQRKYNSGKKKRHTIKTQVLADIETQEILCTAQAEEVVHTPVLRPNNDFQLFKATIRAVLWGILLLADSGYQGLLTLHKTVGFRTKKVKNIR